MKKYERLDINEKVNLEKLKDNELFKKKNGTINIRKIAKQMNRFYSVIWEELNMFDNINDYNVLKAQKIHHKNKKVVEKSLGFIKIINKIMPRFVDLGVVEIE